MTESSPEPVKLAEYCKPPYRPYEIDLLVDLDETRTRVLMNAKFTRPPETPAGASLILNCDDLELGTLRLDGTTLGPSQYQHADNQLIIQAPLETSFELTIESFNNPATNSMLMGLFVSNGIYCTQCEAEGFRRITPFYDRPDVMCTYTTRLEASIEQAPVLLANGNLIDSGRLTEPDRHFAVWHDPFPKPSYLFAMVAGDLTCIEDTFTTQSGRLVALKIFVEPGRETRCAYAMDALKRSMRWDEERFGREYDLDIFMIVAVSDFNMGAMENKGLNIFNDKYILADPDTATDQDYANIEAIIAHEYFHNWTGNRITCRDWFQLCLKEGLTVFRDQEFTSDQRSRAVKRIRDVQMLMAHQFPEDAGPLAHPVRPSEYMEINNFYTATVYEKGAEVIRVLQTMLGESVFAAGLDLYFERHDGMAATVEQFIACFEQASGRDLDQFFLWYTQSGTPSLAATARYDSASKTCSLVIEQSTPATPGQSEKAALHIPLRFALVGPNGEDLDWQECRGADIDGDVIHITAPHHKIVFSGVSARPVPSLLRGFSAPVRLQTNLTEGDWYFLLTNDRDPFIKWQAAQTLAIVLLKKGSAAGRANKPWQPTDKFARTLTQFANSEAFDPDFRALLLTLPGDIDMAREIATDIDPQTISNARRTLKQAIGRSAVDLFGDLYDQLANPRPYSPDATQAGLRALRNIALDYLVAGDVGESAARAQFQDCNNMTDRMAALTSLTRWREDAANDLLAAFYQRYQSDPLVIDKWLQVQATMPYPGTLDRIRSLCSHPAFSASNPNRIRSLIGAFASGNPSQFNRPDGEGYQFVAEMVVEIDTQIPQVAARLLTAFRSWKSLEPGRRAAAQKALASLDDGPNMSNQSTDIVTRLLN